MVCGRHYVRRCYRCGHTESFPLPPLKKKIIYLDQFAVSNMMKAINPVTDAHRKGVFAKGTIEERWVRLFEKLDRLSKMQLIVCPYAEYHEKESMPDRHFQSLKRMYEQLSGTIHFRDATEIRSSQVYAAAICWIRGKPIELDFEPQRVVYGKLDEWGDTILVTIKRKVTDDQVKRLTNFREQVHETMKQIFTGWKLNPRRKLDEYRKRHLQTFWHENLDQYSSYGQRGLLDAAPANVKIVAGVCNIFRVEGIPDNQLPQKMVTFFLDPAVQAQVPYGGLSALLFACLAREATAPNSQMLCPNRGTYYDVEMIATLLPYCDAMFIENKWHEYLRQPSSVKLRSPFHAELFCPGKMDVFFAYLDDIERNANPSHIAQVAKVYGDIQPYLKLFGQSN